MLSEKELKEMMELEDYAHFRAELVEISPQSFDINELKEILGSENVVAQDASRPG